LILDWSPIAFSIHGLSIRWYGVFFSIALTLGFFMMEWFFRFAGKRQYFESFLLYGLVGALLGGRLGHFIFYEPSLLIQNPIAVLTFWAVPGMASHGACFGLLISLWLCSRNNPQLPFLWLIDNGALNLLLIGSIIRIGNFMNGELWGTESTLPWAVFLPDVAMSVHPASLYESLVYGLLFLSLWRVLYRSAGKLSPGLIAGITITASFTFRMMFELVKVHQSEWMGHGFINMGQLLSIPMILLGLGLILYSKKYRHSNLSSESDHT